MNSTLLERMEERRAVTPSGCWEWQGHRTPDGYGVVAVEGLSQSVHREAYKALVGPIPDGLVIDHLCRNRACFNPSHLEPVTSRENTLRSPIAPAALNAAKTVCKNGHEFNDENTYSRDGKTERLCRPCRHDAVRRYRDRRAAALVASAREVDVQTVTAEPMAVTA